MMDEARIRQTVQESLSGAFFPDARQQAVLHRIREEEQPMKRKLSLALVCAVILTLLCAGAALAAALGVFGRLKASPQDAEKLARLDQAAAVVDVTVPLEAPAAHTAAPVLTDCDRIRSRQQERRFALTLSQSYFDGKKLYYSYTLQTDGAQKWQGEGLPTGAAEWMMEETGKRYEDVWSNDIPGRDAEITDWLGSHESSWIAHENWSLGDGARAAGGQELDIIGGECERLDECTLLGWQEVEVPAELSELEEITIELSVLYGATLYHQDESGVRCAHIAQEENRGILHIPFTVSRNGRIKQLQGEARFEAYAAKAGLTVSDVEITGKVILQTPKAWTDALTDRIEGRAEGDVILNYRLMANGEMLPNRGGTLYAPMDGRLEIGLAFDLPDDPDSLSLIPEYAQAGLQPGEAIVLRSAGAPPAR